MWAATETVLAADLGSGTDDPRACAPQLLRRALAALPELARVLLPAFLRTRAFRGTRGGCRFRPGRAGCGAAAKAAAVAAAEHRAGAGVATGDEVDVGLELDAEPREVAVPPELASAIDGDADAQRTFDGLSYSQKTAATRQRRIDKAMNSLRERKA